MARAVEQGAQFGQNGGGGAVTLQERLRNEAMKLRTKSMPLSDLIPLLQQAADALDAAQQERKPAACEHRNYGWNPWTHTGKCRDCFAELICGPNGVEATPTAQQERTGQYSDIVSDGGLDPRNKFDAAQQERKPHTEDDVQDILDLYVDADWGIIEKTVRRILGVPAP